MYMAIYTTRIAQLPGVVILVSVYWPTFYISVLHVVMMVEGLTQLPYPLYLSIHLLQFP